MKNFGKKIMQRKFYYFSAAIPDREDKLQINTFMYKSVRQLLTGDF